MADVLTINEALKRAQAEGIPLPETALRRWVKNGEIPAVYAGKKALLLDEPAAGLDREAAGEMYRLLAELNGTGRTILMITHDPDPVLSNAHKVLRLGRKPFFGSREAYLRESAEGGIGQ